MGDPFCCVGDCVVVVDPTSPLFGEYVEVVGTDRLHWSVTVRRWPFFTCHDLTASQVEHVVPPPVDIGQGPR